MYIRNVVAPLYVCVLPTYWGVADNKLHNRMSCCVLGESIRRVNRCSSGWVSIDMMEPRLAAII